MVEYSQFLDGIVHEPTQSEGRGFDLTVSEVYDVTDAGQVDFGGDELEPAETTPHDGETRDPDDDYEWWHLGAGQYLIEYNESLRQSAMEFTVQTRRAVLERGASHPTLSVESLPRVPLSVGGDGLELKANARVSTLIAAGRA
jgi:hypothetical protein